MEVEKPKPEPVEEVVEALLEYFVAPLFPLNPQLTEPPSLSQQQSVAKQVPLLRRPPLSFLLCLYVVLSLRIAVLI